MTTTYMTSNGTLLTYMKTEIKDGNTIIVFEKGTKGPYIKKAEQDKKPRGRPIGYKNKPKSVLKQV